MKFLKNPLVLVAALILIILGYAGYWYVLRPNQIMKDCRDFAVYTFGDLKASSTQVDKDMHEGAYQQCLHDHGLQATSWIE